jgi:hypothetical protein
MTTKPDDESVFGGFGLQHWGGHPDGPISDIVEDPIIDITDNGGLSPRVHRRAAEYLIMIEVRTG